MALRILLDEDVPADLAEALRKRGLNAVHVDELRETVWQGRTRISDADVCLQAAQNPPTLIVTCNVRDYADRAFVEANVLAHRVAVVMVRVPKREARVRLRPNAIRGIVHRWAHRFPNVHAQAPVVASVSRVGMRVWKLPS